jgi:hypothetical protein
MGELGMLGAASALLVPLLSASFFVPVIIYVVARWRTYREAAPADPQLGLKTALSFFATLSFQTALIGGFLFLYGLFTKGGDSMRGDLMRSAFGVLVPSLLIFGAHFVALQRTNVAELPLIARMFSGVSLIQTGILGFIALVLAFVTLFSRGESGDGGRAVLAAALVYPAAWAVQGLRFLQRVSTGAPPPGLGRPVPPPVVPVPPPAVPPPGYPHA